MSLTLILARDYLTWKHANTTLSGQYDLSNHLLAVNMSARSLVKRNGIESGPYSQEEVVTFFNGGGLSPSNLVCFARKWRWLGRDRWFPVKWLRHPRSLATSGFRALPPLSGHASPLCSSRS